MNSTHDFKTWATLKPDTPFNKIFPDGRVPIVSPLPIIPGQEGNPPCYVVNAQYLTGYQIERLAWLLHDQQPDCESVDQAIEYIRSTGLPLKTDWFNGWGSTDQGLMLSLVELGEDLRQRAIDAGEIDEDGLDAHDDWDDSDLDDEDEPGILAAGALADAGLLREEDDRS